MSSGEPYASNADGTTYNQGLTALDERHKSYLRLRIAISVGIFIIFASIADFAIQTQTPVLGGLLIGTAVFIGLAALLLLPERRYRRWGYDMADEELRVLRGFLWRRDTVVPFNRIQHIDVAQGPLQRIFGLSTLIVHTAGTHNNIVTLPGLADANAETMRETIKAHIRQDMI